MNKQNELFSPDELLTRLLTYAYHMIEVGGDVDDSVFVAGYSLGMQDIIDIIEGAESVSPLPKNHDLAF